jgi:hypothetical protein
MRIVRKFANPQLLMCDDEAARHTAVFKLGSREPIVVCQVNAQSFWVRVDRWLRPRDHILLTALWAFDYRQTAVLNCIPGTAGALLEMELVTWAVLQRLVVD